ncbi:very short patch repair endonuclease [Umezawaea sp. Da 62-37]|uniref:very short patch repair endonuclease n=1 Tax=Umezawaea sp. Da 62-37 TaxID=3075927 RepID=UPI0028F702E2|nr:very short patch repair endonuclease [Umezawaea sp. Da 62-37]WNV83746.1 very short patch repair endonuclease [Umezawaea sp. Da 62-37]
MYKYVDCGPPPMPSSWATAKVMRRTKRTGTGPELALRRALHRRGLRFVVDRAPSGTNRRRRVDVLLRGPRIALFVDGCFWHSCPEHAHLPKANRSWWRLKLRGVVLRDRDTDVQLAAAGWLVVRVWEHEDPETAADCLASLSMGVARPRRKRVAHLRAQAG